MPIVETKVANRYSTDVRFFNARVKKTEEGEEPSGPFINPLIQAYVDAMQPYKDSGKYSQTRIMSDDNLTMTTVYTYADLETFTFADNLLSVAIDAAYYEYMVANNLNHPDNQYKLEGINQPFKCTTTYTFNPEDVVIFESLIDSIESSFCLESFTNTGTVVTAVHHYADSTDFTENHWRDFSYTPYMQAEGVTRTTAYALL